MLTKFNCAVCETSAYGQKAWEQHIAGRRHQANLNNVHAVQEHFRKVQAAQAAEENQSPCWSCTICSVQLPDRVQYESHMKGETHLANAKVECGVFVTGFPIKASSEDLRHCFSNFGKLVEFKRIQGRNFLLLQYEDRQSARNVLQTPVYLCNRRLVIKRRRPQAVPSSSMKVDHKEVENVLARGEDLQALMKELELPSGSEEKFKELCRDLEAAFRPLFPECSACPFGSTVTGLALKGSDMDISLNIAAKRTFVNHFIVDLKYLSACTRSIEASYYLFWWGGINHSRISFYETRRGKIHLF